MMLRLKIYWLALALAATAALSAHPMPKSALLLDVQQDGIAAELRWPLKELQLVFPGADIDSQYTTLLDRKGAWLDAYLLQHMTATDADGSRPWTIAILDKRVTESEQPMTGPYHELVFQLRLQPPPGASLRHLVLHYDAILHQLVTHKMFIKVTRDWYGGLTTRDSIEADLGVLGVNTADGSIPPVRIDLDEGSTWTGFKAMVRLGIDHIASGTDHQMFLFVLLLPAGLYADRRRWSTFGGARYGWIRLVKIATAFTVGHSISLVFGAMQWLVLPQQPVEVAITFTILLTALHAIRPLFYGREILVAAGFGVIHGLAFAAALTDLHLEPGKLALSIVGFNIGIELMQLFLILCTAPWFMALSKYDFYRLVRIIGAVCAMVAACGWLGENISGHPNFVATVVRQLAGEGKWLLAALAGLTIGVLFLRPLPASST
jgi:hypothetical protein